MNERTETPRQGFLGRTATMLRRAWRDAVGGGDVALSGRVRPDLPDDDRDLLRAQIDACLEGVGGAASARARAADLGRTYLALDATGRRRFFETLAALKPPESADRQALLASLEAAGDDPARFADAADRLRAAVQSPRIRLLRQFNGLESGVKFLVDLRADLRACVLSDSSLKFIDRELRDLLSGWFDVGFLELVRINWNAPAALLEKLIDYEAVHAIESWSDLKARLEPGRRAYAFVHPNMPGEPLIFVEVALVEGMADNVQALLAENAPRIDEAEADTAIFYSISNAQRGLDGVSLGAFLIKQVADAIGHDLPGVKTFATLSPIPGFRAWLEGALADEPDLLQPGEAAALAEDGDAAAASAALRGRLDAADWPDDEAASKALRPILTRLCARYLLNERDRGRARDPVAHFHLGNGARVERINWLADRSDAGMARSWGLMVNYRYELSEVEANHEAYRAQGEVKASRAVRGLV